MSAFEESLIASIDEIAHACHEIEERLRDECTLRDRFAMASIPVARQIAFECKNDNEAGITQMAYMLADAMLAARKAKATDAKIAAALAEASLERMRGEK